MASHTLMRRLASSLQSARRVSTNARFDLGTHGKKNAYLHAPRNFQDLNLSRLLVLVDKNYFRALLLRHLQRKRAFRARATVFCYKGRGKGRESGDPHYPAQAMLCICRTTGHSFHAPVLVESFKRHGDDNLPAAAWQGHLRAPA